MATAVSKKALEGRLAGYSSAAKAAVAVTAAAAGSVEAAPVFVDAGDIVLANNGIGLDIDGQGDDELFIVHSTTTSFGGALGTLFDVAWVIPLGGDVTVAGDTTTGLGGTYGRVSRLSLSDNVSSSFFGRGGLSATQPFPVLGLRTDAGFSMGEWATPGQTAQHGYLGLRFEGPGSTIHYGFLELTVDGIIGSVIIHGWAYESVGDVIGSGNAVSSIHIQQEPQFSEVPEPGTLGTLALGAAGIAAWRRKRRGE